MLRVRSQKQERIIMDKKKRVLTEAEAADYIGRISPRTLRRYRCKGKGPRFVRLSPAAVGYRPEDLDEWIDARVVEPAG